VTREEIERVLAAHGAWLAGKWGARADLEGANLVGANLEGAVGIEQPPNPLTQEDYASIARGYRKRNPDVPVVQDLGRQLRGA